MATLHTPSVVEKPHLARKTVAVRDETATQERHLPTNPMKTGNANLLPLAVGQQVGAEENRSLETSDDLGHELACFGRVQTDLHAGISQRLHLGVGGALAA